jgi:hypothetical protein
MALLTKTQPIRKVYGTVCANFLGKDHNDPLPQKALKRGVVSFINRWYTISHSKKGICVSPQRSKPHPLVFNSIHLYMLQTHLQGRVLIPSDDGYERACQTWDTGIFSQYQAIMILPSVAVKEEK